MMNEFDCALVPYKGSYSNYQRAVAKKNLNAFMRYYMECLNQQQVVKRLLHELPEDQENEVQVREYFDDSNDQHSSDDFMRIYMQCFMQLEVGIWLLQQYDNQLQEHEEDEVQIVEIFDELQSEDCINELGMANKSMPSSTSNMEEQPPDQVVDGNLLQESDAESNQHNEDNINIDQMDWTVGSSSLYEHQVDQRFIKRFQCDICDERFCSKDEITKHIRVQHVKRHAGNSEKTNSFATSRKPLKDHENNQSVEKPFVCDVCKKSFAYKSKFKIHLMVHNGDKPFKCEVCQKSFRLKQHLENHLMIHNSDKPYKCEECQMSFRRKCQLEVHLRIHSGEKPFNCNVCNKSFRQRRTLSQHLLIHKNEKPHSCDVCNKSFRQRGALRTHFKTHDQAKQHSCNVCNKSFRRRATLRTHLKTHDRKKQLISCGYCRKVYFSQIWLERHRQKCYKRRIETSTGSA